MAVHKANLDRLAATGLPIQVTELDIDGVASGGVPGDAVQLRNYRRIVPVFWEHPGVEGITVWGWRQPNHWRNAQNAPIVLSDDTPEARGALALQLRARDRTGRSGPTSASRSATSTRPVGTVQADDWASAIGRPDLRTFTWRITDGTDGRVRDRSGDRRASHRRPALLDEHTTYTLKARVSDGYHESDEVDVKVATGDLANVADGGRRRRPCPRRCRCRSAPARASRAFTPGVARDYEASLGATVISTAGDAAPQRRSTRAGDRGPAGQRRVRARPAGSGRGAGAFAPVGATPLTLHTYSGPVSNDPLTIRFKQTIGASEPLRTGAYAKTFTFTLSTTAP